MEEDEVPYVDVVEALEKQLISNRTDRPRTGKIHASDLGLTLGPDEGGCQVAWLKEINGAPPKEKSPGVAWMFANGDAVHESIVILLTQSLPFHGWAVTSVEKRAVYKHYTQKPALLGQPIGPETIGARSDIIITHLETKIKVVIDVKSKRGNAFKYLFEPQPSDVEQLRLYLAAEGAAYGILLYADREGQNGFKAFRIERDDAGVTKAVQHLMDLRAGLIEPVPPRIRANITQNKGPDSVYIKFPWQVEWCKLEHCVCAEDFKKVPPKGVIAKLSGDEGDDVRQLSKCISGMEDICLELLGELGGAHANTTFVLADKPQPGV